MTLKTIIENIIFKSFIDFKKSKINARVFNGH
jgi:hypothetical protein